MTSAGLKGVDAEYAKKKDRVALITGITGQDGSYLAEFLLDHPDCKSMIIVSLLIPFFNMFLFILF